ncbi:MAG: type I-MYXAN CRISPR-associated protein Cas6/Cmx6, partial [Polyangiaceae bacterium]
MNPLVEVSFRLVGQSFPFDHGYALYGALSRIAPDLHGMERFALLLVRGVPVGDGTIRLTSESRLRLRIAADQLASVMMLAGRAIRVGGHDVCT